MLLSTSHPLLQSGLNTPVSWHSLTCFVTTSGEMIVYHASSIGRSFQHPVSSSRSSRRFRGPREWERHTGRTEGQGPRGLPGPVQPAARGQRDTPNVPTARPAPPQTARAITAPSRYYCVETSHPARPIRGRLPAWPGHGPLGRGRQSSYAHFTLSFDMVNIQGLFGASPRTFKVDRGPIQNQFLYEDLVRKCFVLGSSCTWSRVDNLAVE